MSTKKPQAAQELNGGPHVVDHGAEPVESLTVSVEKAAKLLGISRASAYTYVRAGALPSVRLGTRLLVPKAALDRLLAGA
jgi:excisionase family DNA binding protein